jgi:hypothetical protein
MRQLIRKLINPAIWTAIIGGVIWAFIASTRPPDPNDVEHVLIWVVLANVASHDMKTVATHSHEFIGLRACEAARDDLERTVTLKEEISKDIAKFALLDPPTMYARCFKKEDRR